MTMPPAIVPKYIINHTSGSTLAQKKATMTGDGPLTAPADSWAANTIFADGQRTAAGGRMGSMRALAYVLEGAFDPSDEVLATHLAWWVQVDRISRLIASLDAKDIIPWDVKDVDKMRQIVIEGKDKLTPQERKLASLATSSSRTAAISFCSTRRARFAALRRSALSRSAKGGESQRVRAQAGRAGRRARVCS